MHRNYIKWRLILFLIFAYFSSHAQFSFNDPHNEGQINWYFCAGMSQFKPEWHDLSRFTQSFNAYYGDALTKPFAPFEAKQGIRVETGIGLANLIDIGITYTRPQNYTTTATFTNRESKSLRLETWQTDIRFAFNLFRVGRVYSGPIMGAVFNRGRLYSGHQYTNGYLSYGNEQRLNGIFATNHTNMMAGWQIYWMLTDRFTFIGQWEHVNVLVKYMNTSLLGPKDKIDGYSPYYVNHTYAPTFPKDYNEFANNINPNYGITNYLSGNRFTVSFRYNIRFDPDEN